MKQSKRDMIAFLLAGGKKLPLDILSRKRAKAAIPFGAIYRIIDFALSNMMRSAVSHVGVLAQYRPESLMDHIGDGDAWDLFGKRRVIKVLPPYQRQSDSNWYMGTADAVYQNLNFISDHPSETVLIASGDHIYRLDYRKVLNYHREHKADVTIVVKPSGNGPPRRFGMMNVDENMRVTMYEEKPDSPDYSHISLGIYLFNTELLVPLLRHDAGTHSSHDLGRDIISPIVESHNVFAYEFNDLWYYLGTIREFWQANMDLLNGDTSLDLQAWEVQTNLMDGNIANLPPTRFRGRGTAIRSRIPNGCFIEGTVKDSLLFPGVHIRPGACVEKSILMNNVSVGKNSSLYETICDKNVVIGEQSKIGVGENRANDTYPAYFDSGLTIMAKNVSVPDQCHIGKNCLIFQSVDYSTREIRSGSTIGKMQ